MNIEEEIEYLKSQGAKGARWRSVTISPETSVMLEELQVKTRLPASTVVGLAVRRLSEALETAKQ